MVEKESYTVSSNQLVKKVKELIHRGNIRKVRILHKGNVLIEIPLTVGAPVVAAGIVWMPIIAALTAFTLLITECTIEVEKTE